MSESPDAEIEIGITGGYGISRSIDIEEQIVVETPYGEPSHPVVVGELGSKNVAFISRHGEGRYIPAHSINYRANLFAFHRLGVNRIISATANGAINESLSFGDIAVPADYIDDTTNRNDTFFDEAPSRHFSSHVPFCPDISNTLTERAEKNGFECHDDVVLVIVEGPRFATVAEAEMFAAHGGDIMGMSTYPEVTLARELEMCYANFALITDPREDQTKYDRPTTSVTAVDKTLDERARDCTQIIIDTIEAMSTSRCSNCRGHAEIAKSDEHEEWEYRNL